jgi:hypothetical protein
MVYAGICYMISNGFQMKGCPVCTLVIYCFFTNMKLKRNKERMNERKKRAKYFTEAPICV